MKALFSLLDSSIGKKFLMALTGLALIGFVVAHLGGNLLVYGKPDLLNSYAEGLHKQPTYTLLWFARGGLLAFFLSHVFLGIKLSLQNRSARPKKYKYDQTTKATFSSRTMIYSGLVLLSFILFHLAHYTFFLVHPEYSELLDATGRHDVHTMIVAGFSSWPISIFYMVSMVLLWMHLCHGGSSVFQSLGISHPKYKTLTTYIGPAIATFLLLGNCSIPLAVLCGVITGGH